MGVQYESTSFGDVRAAAIHGRPGVGVSELAFSLNWVIQPKRSEVLSLFGTSAWISVLPVGVEHPLFLGHASPETAWCTETRDHAGETNLLYRLTLPSPQLLAIEELRHGRELVFHIDVRGNSLGPRGVRPFDQKLMLRVNISDWIRVLKEANAADVLLVGVHLPTATLESRFRASIDLVRKANEHLILGHYSAAVAECRRAIESLWKAAALTDDARDARKQLVNMGQQMSMSKRSRELALGEALRIFCHGAHHVGQDAEPEDFGRLDAALAVGSVAALISSLVAAPSLLVPKAQSHEVLGPSVVAATPVHKSPVDNSIPDRLTKAIVHFRKRPANRPSTDSALRSLLESLFSKKLTVEEIDAVIGELKTKGIVKANGKKLEYNLLAAES
jgi:hypothetical protein